MARYNPLMRNVGRPIAAPQIAVNKPETGKVIKNGTPCDSSTEFV